MVDDISTFSNLVIFEKSPPAKFLCVRSKSLFKKGVLAGFQFWQGLGCQVPFEERNRYEQHRGRISWSHSTVRIPITNEHSTRILPSLVFFTTDNRLCGIGRRHTGDSRRSIETHRAGSQRGKDWPGRANWVHTNTQSATISLRKLLISAISAISTNL
ncbi:hypothetical protein BC941DRAFT_513534 [Chlamydoabsidia padenii]|nr:hypothetical protein BC941DRAFT_513534 [Chlamydoabsidia padenii]